VSTRNNLRASQSFSGSIGESDHPAKLYPQTRNGLNGGIERRIVGKPRDKLCVVESEDCNCRAVHWSKVGKVREVFCLLLRQDVKFACVDHLQPNQFGDIER